MVFYSCLQRFLNKDPDALITQISPFLEGVKRILSDLR